MFKLFDSDSSRVKSNTTFPCRTSLNVLLYSEIAFFTPVFSPGVPQDPMFVLRVCVVIANYDNAMVDLDSALAVEDATLVVLDAKCFDSCGNRPVDELSFHGPLAIFWQLKVGAYISDNIVLFPSALLLSSFVRIVSL
jgi:hypothetical protein